MSGGVLYDRMREKRGLNYGDYAYIEYFPRGMFLMEPQPNLARHHQIFQMWIRPVEPPTAKFALRLALFELDKLIKDGLPQEEFERTREFLGKYVNVLTRTKRAELGYAIDSSVLRHPSVQRLPEDALAKLTLEDVNRAIKQYICDGPPGDRGGVAQWRGPEAATGDRRSVADDVQLAQTAGDHRRGQIVEKWPLHLQPEDIKMIPVDEVFQNGTKTRPARNPRGRQPDSRPVALHQDG